MKTKIFFVIGILMLVAFVVCVLFDLLFIQTGLWLEDGMWKAFYAYFAIIIIIFLLPAVIHIVSFIRDDDSLLNMLSAICASIGSAMFAFALAFFWYAVNHPQMSAPLSLEATNAIYNSYAVITIALLLAAIVLKITVGVNKVRDVLKKRKAKKATE
ncbi:MAG: hypothetical protein IKL59_06455 [Clostridia bacterium]|nr:hypothetical protein [Clostridia bacterium]